MTPQVFLNYRLKSVDHLPWRVLSYQAVNTFIDDVFMLCIRMPEVQKYSVFRDDIVFVICCVQRWLYKGRRSVEDEADHIKGEAKEGEQPSEGKVAESGSEEASKAGAGDQGLRQRSVVSTNKEACATSVADANSATEPKKGLVDVADKENSGKQGSGARRQM